MFNELRHRFLLVLILSVGSLPANAKKYADDGTCMAETYVEIIECAAENRTAALENLDEIRAQFRNDPNVDDVAKKLLETSEEDWMKYVDSTCELHGDSARDGTLWSVNVANCKINHYKKRFKELSCIYAYRYGDHAEQKHRKHCRWWNG